MQGNIEADLTKMPFENMVILFCGITILLIVFAVIIFILTKKLGIKSIGAISFEQRGQTTLYSMNEKTRDADDACRKKMRQITSDIKLNISNIFAELKICIFARVAISSAVRFPLYESVANNHFTKELMPDKYDAYRKKIIEMLQEEYKGLSVVSKDIQCNREPLPAWDDVKNLLIGCVDLWLERISHEVQSCCENKIGIYKEYLPDFEAAKDNYRSGIVKKCIEKNERYITVLKARIP